MDEAANHDSERAVFRKEIITHCNMRFFDEAAFIFFHEFRTPPFTDFIARKVPEEGSHKTTRQHDPQIKDILTRENSNRKKKRVTGGGKYRR